MISSISDGDTNYRYPVSFLSSLLQKHPTIDCEAYHLTYQYEPVIASIPLLVVYFAGHGVTDVVLPRSLGFRALLNVEASNGVFKLGMIRHT